MFPFCVQHFQIAMVTKSIFQIDENDGSNGDGSGGGGDDNGGGGIHFLFDLRESERAMSGWTLSNAGNARTTFEIRIPCVFMCYESSSSLLEWISNE